MRLCWKSFAAASCRRQAAKKAIEADEIQMAFVALDADLLVTKKVIELARQRGLPIVEVDTMKALGEAADVAVPTAAAGIKKAIV